MKLKDSEQHMRGSPHSQVEGLFHFVSGIGVSRHKLKTARTPDVLVHSDNTRSVYLRVWHAVAGYALATYGISQILEIRPYHMVEWLELQVSRGLAPATVRTYSAALSKFLSALYYYKTEAGRKRRHR